VTKMRMAVSSHSSAGRRSVESEREARGAVEMTTDCERVFVVQAL